VREYVKRFVGEQSAARYERITRVTLASGSRNTTMEQRQKSKVAQPAWWTFPTKNTLDRATAMLPKLLYERLPDMGLDYSVLFPTSIMTMVPFMRDEELRRGGTRALNTYAAELFGDYADRMTPVTGIPIHTPQEAIEEFGARQVAGAQGGDAGGAGQPAYPRRRRPLPDLARSAGAGQRL
jgi:predicted TIM-barrel fold metal-dependent hydrolase